MSMSLSNDIVTSVSLIWRHCDEHVLDSVDIVTSVSLIWRHCDEHVLIQ